MPPPLPWLANAPSVASIIRTVEAQFWVTPGDVVSLRKDRQIVMLREVAMWLACRLTPHSFTAIARCFGRRDSKTVIRAEKRVDQRMSADVVFAAGVLQLQASILRASEPSQLRRTG